MMTLNGKTRGSYMNDSQMWDKMKGIIDGYNKIMDKI